MVPPLAHVGQAPSSDVGHVDRPDSTPYTPTENETEEVPTMTLRQRIYLTACNLHARYCQLMADAGRL